MPISLDRDIAREMGKGETPSTHLCFAPRSSFTRRTIRFHNFSELYKRERRKKLEYEYMGGYIFDGEGDKRERTPSRKKENEMDEVNRVLRFERERSSRERVQR